MRRGSWVFRAVFQTSRPVVWPLQGVRTAAAACSAAGERYGARLQMTYGFETPNRGPHAPVARAAACAALLASIACSAPEEPPAAADAAIEDALEEADAPGVEADAAAAPDDATSETIDAEARQPDAALPNLLPIPRLSYEIELNVWVTVNEGDTVVRPLEADINWLACASYDPDGSVAEIWLHNGKTTKLQGGTVECGEHTETDHEPRDDVASRLRVVDDDGGESELSFTYRTE